MSNQVNQKRLLLVDDDKIVRIIHKTPLIEAGFIVEEAENGKQAIERFIANKGLFSVVLMDFNMPGMNGAQATKELRRIEGNNRHTLIIGITSDTSQNVRTICLEAGMDDVFSKPILPPDLEKLVNSFIH